MTTKVKGGRGHIAPYQTTHLRVPIPIKEQLQFLVDTYKEQVMLGRLDCTVSNLFPSTMPSKDKAVEIAASILKSKKSAKQSMSKLLSVLYGEEVSL